MPGREHARRLTRIVGYDDARERARRRLPRALFEYVDGGAEDEVTMRANVSAFRDLTFRPRVGIFNPEPTLNTTVLGIPVSIPVLTAPCGGARLVHPQGDIGIANAAARAGTIPVVASSACFTLEEIASRSREGPKWFQLYRFMNPDTMRSLATRADAAGYEALVVTMDTVATGHREKDIRNGFSYNLRPSLRSAARMLPRLGARPGWLWQYARDGMPFEIPNTAAHGYKSLRLTAMGRVTSESQSPTWEDISWLRGAWKKSLLIKGVLTAEDALRAVDAGADAIIVSNHGGRQLEGAPATMHALPEIACAVGDRAEILLDSGIRRGNDVLKALALGAKAVLIGRMSMYGLAAGGEAGVQWMLEILRSDIYRSMRLMGLGSVEEIDHAWIDGFQPKGGGQAGLG
jgi:L-lactate dehydrogenase (cytochrome)